MHRNNELFQVCQDWIREVLSWLVKREVYTKAQKEMERLNLDTSGVWMSKYAVWQQADEFFALPASKDLISHLLRVFADTYVNVDDDSEVQDLTREWTARRIAHRFIDLYLDRHLNVDFRPEVFESLYSDLEQLLYLPGTIEVMGLVEFENAEFEIDDVQIAKNVRLRRVQESEAKRRNWFISREPFRERPEVVLEIETRFAGNVGLIDAPLYSDNRHEIDDSANAVLLALRLTHSQPICVYAHRFIISNAFLDHAESVMVSENSTCGIPVERSINTARGKLPLNRSRSSYIVSAKVVEEIRALWPKASAAVRMLTSDQEWSLAVTRFSDAYRRSKRDDQLIDYWIALEALFLPRERVPEMGVSAGLAISHYLGESSTERRSLFELVKASHTLRSDVVHGKAGKRDQQFDLNVEKTGEVLRRSMLKRIREF